MNATSKEDRTKYAIKKFINYLLTVRPNSKDCLQVELDGSSVNSSILKLSVIEIHNKNCGGDPNTSSTYGFFNINTETGAVLKQDRVTGEYVPVQIVAPDFRGIYIGADIEETNRLPAVLDGYMPGISGKPNAPFSGLTCKPIEVSNWEMVTGQPKGFVRHSDPKVETDTLDIAEVLSCYSSSMEMIKGPYQFGVRGIEYHFLNGKLYSLTLDSTFNKLSDDKRQAQCSQFTSSIIRKFSDQKYDLFLHKVPTDLTEQEITLLSNDDYTIRVSMNHLVEESWFAERKSPYCSVTFEHIKMASDSIKIIADAQKRVDDIGLSRKKINAGRKLDYKYDI